MKSLNMNDYVTISKDAEGYFVEERWFNKRTGDHVLYDRGISRYENFIDALDEALEWAEHEDLEYVATMEREEHD